MSKENDSDKRLLQPAATLRNGRRRIVAPKGAGSSPVGLIPGLAKIEFLRRMPSHKAFRMISKGEEVDTRADETHTLRLPYLLALPQACLPSADDRLSPVSYLELGEDIRDVVANGLRT